MIIGKLILFLGSLLLALVVLVIVGVFVIARQRLQEIEVTPGPVSTQPGTYRVQLEHGGRDREYLVHVPPGAGGASLPLFVALHGGGGTAERTDDLARLTPIADRDGFLVAFPQGIDKNWNDGRTGTRSKAQKENVDDVGFIRAVIDDIAANLPLDRRRVYAAGISNGALMSSRLACEAADVIAAVGLVVATAPAGFEAWCRPGRGVPVIAFLGTKDPLVPFEGGEIEAFVPFIKRGRVVSAEALIGFWVRQNGCDPAPTVTELPDVSTGDHSRVVLSEYGGCEEGAGVAFYRVEGGGHTWPGGKQYLTRWLVGYTNRDISASELMWRFFEAHALP